MIIKGLKFGMLLQLAVGPMCVMVFNTSAKYGIREAIVLVLAITIIDFLYIALSGIGIGAVLDRRGVKKVIKIFGAVVLLFFGINMLTQVFEITLLPNLSLFTQGSEKNFFLQGLILTASNPLTIVFWSGIFSAQVLEHNYNKRQLMFFGLGCILSTFCFLSFIAVLGLFLHSFLSAAAMKVLNFTVGIILVYFAFRLILKKDDDKKKIA